MGKIHTTIIIIIGIEIAPHTPDISYFVVRRFHVLVVSTRRCNDHHHIILYTNYNYVMCEDQAADGQKKVDIIVCVVVLVYSRVIYTQPVYKY